MAKHTDSPTDGPDANAPERSRRILVVEEDRVEGGMLAFHLRREGLIVMLMAGEDEAIDAVAWAPPDAILIEKSGRDLDAFRVIRALGDAPVLVYLMADGPLALEDDLEALRLGVAHTFTKPLDPAQVASRLGARPMTPPRPRPVEVPDDGIAGDLELHPVTSLLQFCHRHRMNARVHIEMQDDWGVLLVRHGDVIDAESPGASGREAAYQAVSSANQGTFVLFPLALDAEELSRDDVVRADLATLVTEAFSKENAASQKAAQQAMPLQHADSPRGPLSRQTARTGPLKKLETLEYPAVRADDAGKQADAEEPSRARVRKQVGMPTVAPDAEAAEPQPTTDAPEQAAPKPETKPEAAPRTSRKSKRRRVPSDIARKQARIPTNPATATATATATKPPTQQQPVVEPSENTTIAGASSVVRVGPGSAAGSESHDAITTLKNAEAPTDAMLTAAVAAAREEQQGGDPRIGRMSTATDVRADRAATKQEPDFDEPTDVNKKSPLDGPRVRRKTGQFAIGDASAPDEETAHNLDPMDDDDTVLGATKRSGPPLLLIALAALVVVSILFVAWRLATKPSVEEAPPAAAAAPSLTESEKTMVAFGEGIAAHEAGRFEDAESRFTDLIKSGNQPKGVLAGLASAYFQQGKFEDARNLLDDLSRSQPDDPRIWAYLGAVYSKLGKHDEARTALERAVDVSDDGPLKQQLEAALGAEPKP